VNTIYLVHKKLGREAFITFLLGVDCSRQDPLPLTASVRARGRIDGVGFMHSLCNSSGRFHVVRESTIEDGEQPLVVVQVW
jgi:hypothetical protein